MKRILILMLNLLLIVSLTTVLASCDGTVNSDSNAAKGVDKPFEPTYTVNTNGGSAVASKTLNILESAPESTKKDHLFDGWYRDAALTTVAIFPLTLEANTTLYAKWLKIRDTQTCKDASIKWGSNTDASASWQITPTGFDLERLEELGLVGINITVTYNVRYRKDYDVLWDIGYAGSPRYEVMIVNSNGMGTMQENLSTSKSATERTISCGVTFSTLKNERIYLTFSTDNIQNKIYFEDIVVTYECAK